MKKNSLIVIVLILFTLAASGCGLLRDPAAPSGELEAVPVEVAETAPAAAEVVAEEPAAVEVVEEPTAVMEEVEATEPAAEEAAAASGGVTVYTIQPQTSSVRFELNEVLRGEPKTVVGTTDQVTGEIAVDLSDLSTAQVGLIQVNARTLTTDNNFRNRAINNEILDTGAYEFITFAPTDVNVPSGSAAVGDTVEFTIDGDLTIRDITQPVTFAVTAVPVSDSQLEGTAAAVVQRADYNLIIPSVPNVADVEEEVELYIDFVANAS
jgi:polyisoprenoid-binding protein YceI